MLTEKEINNYRIKNKVICHNQKHKELQDSMIIQYHSQFEWPVINEIIEERIPIDERLKNLIEHFNSYCKYHDEAHDFLATMFREHTRQINKNLTLTMIFFVFNLALFITICYIKIN